MSESNTFLGEVAIFHAQVPDAEFGAFEKITNLATIHQIAREYSDFLELMPYQQLGNELELNLSVYLRPVFAEGMIIAIVARASFPKDLDALDLIVDQGIHHLELLKVGIGTRFEQSSIETAAEKLNLIKVRIADMHKG